MIEGYKCFNADFTNQYGKKFEVGKIYTATGKIKFKNNGFHLCTYIEDVFRFFDAKNKEIIICKVKGTGNFSSSNDEYNGYFDMYSVEKIEIIKKLTREEIIQIGLSLNDDRAFRFIQGYTLTQEEIKMFKTKFSNSLKILKAIAYYQEGNKTIYENEYKKLIKRKK